MNHHEYIAGFFGVVIGFTVTELIKGIADTFKNFDRVKYYYPHGLYVVLMFFFIMLNFFDFYQYFSRVDVWTPTLLIRYSFPAIFACFFCYLIFPSFVDGEVDFKKHYFRVIPIIYSLVLLMIGLVLFRNIFFLKANLLHISIIISSSIFLVTLISLLIRKDWSQYLFFAITLPSVIYWTLTYKLI